MDVHSLIYQGKNTNCRCLCIEARSLLVIFAFSEV